MPRRHSMRHGGDWISDLQRAFDPNQNGVAQAFQPLTNEFTNPNSILRTDIVPKIENEVQNPDSVFRTQVLPAMVKAAEVAATVGAGRPRRHHGRGYTGAAWYDDLSARLRDENSLLRKGIHEVYDPQSYLRGKFLPALGYGGAMRAPRAPSRRGAIVSSVMRAYPGMSLAHASSYVKTHGLY